MTDKDALIAERNTLKAQRDELVEALKRIARIAHEDAPPKDAARCDERLSEIAIEARTALAKEDGDG